MVFIIGFFIQIGNDSYDIYDVCGIFIVHGNDPFAVKELAFVYFGGICIDVYYRTENLLQTVGFPNSFQIEINKVSFILQNTVFAAF